jgi:hypothetical protein
MKGNLYLRLLERWEFINDLPLDVAIKEIDPEMLNSLLQEWQALHESSIQSDGVCNKVTELPMIPVSSINLLNPDLIANVALYSDRQIIQDPIDCAIEKTIDPIENIPRFLFYLKRGMRDLAKLRPLLRENLIELIPYSSFESKFSLEINNQLYKDWFDNTALHYLENKIKYKLYKESNVLAFQVGDLNTMPFERYTIFGGGEVNETEDYLEVDTVTPASLDNVDPQIINKWVTGMKHITSNRIANKINRQLLTAELFSGSVATNELISYEFINRKCFKLSSTQANQGSIHKIPILGNIDLEKFVDFRSNELPSYIAFRQEWNEGRGLFKENTSSQEWMDNINKELEKCKQEINKNKKKIFNNVVSGFTWAGLGVMAGIYTGDLLNPAILTNLVPFIRDMKNALGAYYEMKQSFRGSSPFFLVNVIDGRNNRMRTDVPLDLPEKMPFNLEKIISPLSILAGTPIMREASPQGKCELFTGES